MTSDRHVNSAVASVKHGKVALFDTIQIASFSRHLQVGLPLQHRHKRGQLLLGSKPSLLH